MIMIFKRDINGRKSSCEIKCSETDAETFRHEMIGSGWILVSVVAPKSPEWKNIAMKCHCIHGSVCEDDQCIDCFDFEM